MFPVDSLHLVPVLDVARLYGRPVVGHLPQSRPDIIVMRERDRI